MIVKSLKKSTETELKVLVEEEGPMNVVNVTHETDLEKSRC